MGKALKRAKSLLGDWPRVRSWKLAEQTESGEIINVLADLVKECDERATAQTKAMP